jgi:putative transcriptional regulator
LPIFAYYIKIMQMRLINRLKIVLAEQNKTNKWLAEAVNKNETTISRWCTNETQPSLETLVEIAQVLNVDVRELLHRTL